MNSVASFCLGCVVGAVIMLLVIAVCASGKDE